MDLENSRIHPDYIVAFLMLLVVVSEVYRGWDSIIEGFKNEDYWMLEFFLDVILCFIGATILLLTKHRSIVKTLIVSSIVFASLSLDAALNGILISGEVLDYDISIFIIAAIQLTLAAMLLGNILIYWMKASASLDGMLYSMIGILCLNIVDDLSLLRHGTEIGTLFQIEIWLLPMYALMIFNILLLRSKSVRVHTMLYNIMESSEDIRRSVVPIGVRIDRSEIAKLKEMAETGLSQDRYEIDLNSFYPIDYRIILTKNGDRITLRFCSVNDDTGTSLARFNLQGVWMDTGDAGTCDLVRIYGEGMFFIQLIAGGPFRSSSEKRSLSELLKG